MIAKPLLQIFNSLKFDEHLMKNSQATSGIKLKRFLLILNRCLLRPSRSYSTDRVGYMKLNGTVAAFQEVLHLSERERKIVLDCFSKIEYELEDAIDKHRKKMITSNLEML